MLCARFDTATQPKLHRTRARTDQGDQPFTVSTLIQDTTSLLGLLRSRWSFATPSHCWLQCKSLRTLLLRLLPAWSDRAS